MRLGLVRFINAKPLGRGFIRDAERDPTLQLLEETPARLSDLLRNGELDAALISTVEALRYESTLGHCSSVGVCARNKVDSILYIKRKEAGDSSEEEFYKHPPKGLYVDSSSRSSVALLDILLESSTRRRVPQIITPPEEIPGLVKGDYGGLLIGDAALKFQDTPMKEEFHVKDLATWWYEQEGLPFVFAVWTFPRERPLPDSFFESSLEAGLRDLDLIIQESYYSNSEEYLRHTLHYRLNEEDKKGILRFKSRLQALDLL